MNISPDGYYRVKIKGISYKYHRLLIEEKLGRKLLSSEFVHHINSNKLDNRIKNLLITSLSEHNRLHKKQFVINGKKQCTECKKWFPVKKHFSYSKTEFRWTRWCKSCQKSYDHKKYLRQLSER